MKEKPNPSILLSRLARFKNYLEYRRLRFKSREEANFLRQLAMLVGTGSQIFDSLVILANGSTGATKIFCDEVAEDIRRGMSLSRAFEKRQHQIGSITPFMIKVGESGGRLSLALRWAAEWAEINNDLYEKIRSTLVYPIFVLIVNLFLAIALLIFVLPAFMPIFEGHPLPFITHTLILTSKILQHPLTWIIGGLLFLELLSLAIREDSQDRLFKLGLLIPGVRALILNGAKTRFLKVLVMTFSSGVPFARGFFLAAKASGHPDFCQLDDILQEELRSGGLIEEHFESHKLTYGSFISQGIRLSIETGEFSKVCEMMAKYYLEETYHSAEKTKVLLEPLLLIFVGLTTTVILLATYMPLASMVKNFGQ